MCDAADIEEKIINQILSGGADAGWFSMGTHLKMRKNFFVKSLSNMH